MAYNWRTMQMPLASGVNTKPDPRALPAPGLAVARDVQFDELGGLQTRKPFASIGNNILGGGTLSSVRRVVSNGTELLCFTKTALYSWSARDSAWVLKGTHLAAKISEQSVFTRTTEQTQCDRAELGNTVFYTWVDEVGSTSVAYIGAADKTTGAVILAPTAVSGATSSRPRLVVLASVVVLFYIDDVGDLAAKAINPSSIASSVAAAATSIATANSYYDATTDGTTAFVALRLNPTTSYEVCRVTAALAVTSSTKARACAGPIALAISPGLDRLQILRTGTSNTVVGDLLNATTLADVITASAVGTSTTAIENVTGAFRSVTNGGQYRCYAFWTEIQESASSVAWASKYNWIDIAGSLGTQARLAYRLGVASRAFDHDGSVYVWAQFAGTSYGGASSGNAVQLQNTYFLYRDDLFLVAKAAMFRAGGFNGTSLFTGFSGHLPNVQSLGSGVFAWAGVERRVIPMGGSTKNYSASAPVEIKVTFDSDEARRCVRLGETLYITGGEILQYDGVGLYEVGFHIYPWWLALSDVAGGGDVAEGSYSLRNTLRWDNAKGERERSTTATIASVTVESGSDTIRVGTWIPIQVTHKTSPAAVSELWRTTVNPTFDSPSYLITSQDPTATGPNGYVENDYDLDLNASFDDDFSDADASEGESFYENGSILENLVPPPATVIAASQDRIFLAGIANAPNQVWYSKLRGPGEIAAFHDTLTIDLPPEGGPITALGFLDELLIAFKESAVFALPGDGFDNASGGQNYGPARRISADVGAVNAESVAVTPSGLIFKSNKGWYLLSRGGAVQYIGDKVASFDSDTVKAVHTVEAQHQVRCLTGSRMLVWDYLVNEWSEWTIADGLGACIWDGTHAYAFTTGVKTEQSAYSSLTYGIDIETAWIPLADLQGFGAVRWIMTLGEFRSTHAVRVRIAYNYAESDASGPTWVDDKSFTATPTTIGGPLQFRHGPKRHRVESIKIRLTAHVPGDTATPPTGEALKLTGLALEVGFEPGLYRRLPAAQKQ